MSTPAELIASAGCIDGCIPQGQKLSVLIWELAILAGVSTDPKTLMESASCIYSCVPEGMKPAIIADLQDKILANQLTGASACLLHGLGAPVAVPVCPVALYVDDSSVNAGVWIWTTSLGQWVEIITPGP